MADNDNDRSRALLYALMDLEKKLTKREKAEVLRVIDDLQDIITGLVTYSPVELEQHLAAAEKVAVSHGVNLPPADPSSEVGELLPDPGHPLAVARVLVREWTGADGQPKLRHWGDQWVQYDGSRWVRHDEQQLRGWLYKRLENATYVHRTKLEPVDWKPTKAKLNAVLDALGAALVPVPQNTVTPAWLDTAAHPDPRRIVAVANGLLDTTTGTLHPGSAAFFNEVASQVRYDPQADEPERWTRFLAELWPNDPQQAELLQEWMGYVLSGRTDMQKIGLVIGPPRSGKGTIIRVLEALIGGSSVGLTMANMASGFGLMNLPGKALAVISDARVSRQAHDTRVALERLLTISGEDNTSVDIKYRRQWSGTLSARFMVVSNEAPSFDDPSGTIASRFVVLTTTNSFLGREDTKLTGELIAELPGILNWALDGLTRLDRNGGFTVPDSSAETVRLLSESASPARMFVDEECIIDPAATVSKDSLYKAWQRWCKATGNSAGTIQQFSTALQAAMGGKLKTTRPRTGNRGREWSGLRLRTYFDDSPRTPPVQPVLVPSEVPSCAHGKETDGDSPYGVGCPLCARSKAARDAAERAGSQPPSGATRRPPARKWKAEWLAYCQAQHDAADAATKGVLAYGGFGGPTIQLFTEHSTCKGFASEELIDWWDEHGYPLSQKEWGKQSREAEPEVTGE